MVGVTTLTTVALSCSYGCIAWFLWRLHSHRSWINKLRHKGMPMPPWNWLTGHLFYFARHTQGLTKGLSINLAIFELSTAFKENEMFLLDMWPLSEPMLVVFNPAAAHDVCQRLNLVKGKKNEDMIQPITGGLTLLSMNGEIWKAWRTLLNPGFSSAAIMEHIPKIVDRVSSLCERLENCARGDIVYLDHLFSQLTFEIILRVGLNVELGTDYDQHVFVQAMGNIISWHSFWNPLILMNPLRPFINWWNGRIVNNWIENELQQRYETFRCRHDTSTTIEKWPAKSVMDLAIDGYMNDHEFSTTSSLAPSFVKSAIHQMRLFLFVGNDTTSSTLVFACHLLSKNPTSLARLRDEHERIFGSDLPAVASKIKEDPTLLSKCEFTLAVIKETLRLYAPAATMRMGNQGCILTTLNGFSFPTNNMSILLSHHSIHRNERLWSRAEDFLPDRWLVGPEHSLYPQSGAWRPFEFGPRNCIGQTLSMNELKIVLIMITRHFNITPAYEEHDQIKIRNEGWMKRAWREMGMGNMEAAMYRGDRAYQTEKAGSHPSEGYPCRVSICNR